MKKTTFLIALLFTAISSTFAQGCLMATSGQYPADTYVPTCNGVAGTVTGLGYAGEYSVVTVTAGTEYTFTSSVDTDYITISADDGITAAAYGVTPVIWTPAASGDVRFYTHLDAACGESTTTLRTRSVTCGTFVPLVNDNFADAIEIACGSNYSGDTTTATLDQGDAPAGFGADMDAPNVWYKYTGSGFSETVTLNLCGSSYDSSVLVYTGAPGSFTLVAGNDDDATCGPAPANVHSRVSFTSDGSTTYYIAIEGYNATNVGAYSMDVTCAGVTPPAVTNQVCDTSLPVSVDGFDVTSDNSFGDVSPTQPTCDQFGSIQDVWFSFVAPASGLVDVLVTPTTMTSLNLAAYSGICTSLVALGCTSNQTAAYTASLTGLAAGTTYYLQVWSNAAEQGTFSLRLSDPGLAVSAFDSSSFRAYPNPVKNKLTLSSGKNVTNVSVFNLLGQEVMTKSATNVTEIDMSQLQTGSYMVKVTADNQIKTIKIVKE